MLLPSKDIFTQDINFIENEKLKEKIILLYDNFRDISGNNLYLQELLAEVLNELFNPFGVYSEPNIPFSFFKTTLGKLILAVMNQSVEKVYTIQDLKQLTKVAEKPEGYSKQYLSQEIKSGKLLASWNNGRWEIPGSEVQRYLKEKGFRD